MHNPNRWLALFTLTCAMGMGAPLEFSGYFRTGATCKFVLTDLEDSTASAWLSIGENFRGQTLAAFDAKTEVLTIQNAAGARQLSLKTPVVKDIAAEASKPKGVVVESGLYADGDIDSEVSTADSNGQPVYHFNGGRFVGPNVRVSIERGRKFGFFADLSGLPPSAAAELEYLCATPPMQLPDGRIISSSYFTNSVTTTDSGTAPRQGMFYSFDHDFELVPGRYRLEIRYQSRLLAAQEFEAYQAAPQPKAPTLSEKTSPNQSR